jgi:hypothetical protein
MMEVKYLSVSAIKEIWFLLAMNPLPVTQYRMRPLLLPRTLWGLYSHPENYKTFPVTQNFTRPFLSPRTFWVLSCHPEPDESFPVTLEPYESFPVALEPFKSFPVTKNLMRPFLPPRTLRCLFHDLISNKNKMTCVFIGDLELGNERNAVLVIPSRNFPPLIEINSQKDVHIILHRECH